MFRWFRYFGLVVSVVTVVSFRWFRFGVSSFSTCLNRGEVLTACFRDKQSQRSIRMEFVVIMILFDVMDYRLLYGNCSILRYRSVRVRRKY